MSLCGIVSMVTYEAYALIVVAIITIVEPYFTKTNHANILCGMCITIKIAILHARK